MAWKDIKEQRKSGKSSWADVKRSRGIGDGDTSEDGVSRLVGATKINTKDLTKGRATNTSPITVDPKVVIEAKQNRYRVPDATSDPDFEKYSTLGNRKAESGKIKIGPVEIKSGFNRLDNSEDYMQPGEKKIYDYWIGKGDKESATKFLKGLEPEINRRRAFKEDQMMTDITRNSKAAGVAMELTTNLAAPAGYLSTAKDFITGEDIDPNSPAYMAARATNSIENELFRESSDFTKFLGQTGLSMGKFATALPFGQVGALTIMSSGAAGSTAWDATNRGASTNEAMMLGTAAGITEYLTERLPVDNLFRLAKSGVNLITKEGVKQVLKQAGIEGTEEVVSQYVNTLTDIAVMGSRSNYERYKAELVASGLSIEEAESQAKIDMFIKEPAIAFAGGALSGGVFGAGAGAVSTYNVSKVGSQMRGLGIEQDIVDTGLESGAETGSNQTATKVADIMKAGGKVSNYDIGKLYYENINAVNAENDEAQRKGIESMLRDAGVTEAEPISRVMQKAFSGDPLSNTEAEAIITNEAARNMFTSFTGQDIPIGTMSSMRRAVKGFSENVVKGTAQPILIQPNEAQIEPQPEANAKMEQPVAAAPKMNVQPQQTMERPLSREEIKAQVSKFGQAGAKSYGVNLKDQQDINKYTAGFSAYYIAGKSGLSYDDTMKANSNYDLPDTVKFSAYSAGQNDAKTDTKTKPVYSKEAGLKQTEESKDIKKNVAKVLDSIGKATGVKVVMVKSIDVNGEKAAANGLYMNGVLQIASDADNPILVVAKHEVTHRLQETSPEAYKEYKDYVVQVMIKQGTLAANMKKLDILYKKRGVQMSHDEILDEIVANFTEQILTDVDAINDLVQTNRTLAQQILDMLREFMATIKEAIGKVDPSVRNQLGFNYDELKKAEALWVKALKTAEEGESDAAVTSEEEMESSYVQYSLVKDKETLDFLENQNQVPVYRAMQVIDGKLYPPMAAKVATDGKRNLVMSSKLNAWEQADERPDLIKNGKFTLDKANGSSIAASYNPYFHTSRSPLNDQFSSAYKRPNIVVVEGLVPESELTSKYHAPYAKDSVGEMDWHSGPVSSKLPEGKKRKVILSRWFKPLRIVPDSEAAQKISALLDGENIPVPRNVVTPSLLEELEKLGVQIGDQRGLKDAQLSLKDSDVFAENRAKAIEKFGTTTNFNEAGYLLPDGKMLDFSGKKESGVPNVRWMDHRDIQDIYDEIGHTDAMNQFISEGNIRMMPESPGLDMVAGIKPTEQQLSVIEKYINKTVKDNYFSADISDKEGNVVASLSYDGKVNAKKIISDIQHYYSTGNVPRKSELDQFRYSLKDKDYMAAVESGDMETAQRMVDEAASQWGAYQVDGKPHKFYHATNGNFTVFEKGESGGLSGKGIYFGYDRMPYGENTVEAYLKMDRPMAYKESYDIDGVREVVSGNKTKIIPDVYEKFPQFDGILGRDEVTVRDPSQIKSADPVVYDDAGNVIPLSQRFDESSEDIRYSLKDSEGNQLTKEQAEFFKDSKVRDAEGNLLRVYHGSFGVGKFFEFDTDTIFLTTDSFVASKYSSAERIGKENVHYYSVYANLENPLVVDASKRIEGKYDVTIKSNPYTGKNTIELSQNGETAKTITTYNPDDFAKWFGENKATQFLNGISKARQTKDAWGNKYHKYSANGVQTKYSYPSAHDAIEWNGSKYTADELAKAAKAKGYDGVIINNVIDDLSFSETGTPATNVIAFRSNQVKLTTNLNPTDDPDIRYSIKDSEYVDEIEDAVVGGYDGQTNYLMTAYKGGNAVGTLDYSEYEGEPSVNMVEVSEEHRRQGIGTVLLQQLQKKYADKLIQFGYTTDDGNKLIGQITETIPNPLYDPVIANRVSKLNSQIENLKKEQEDINQELLKYYPKYKDGSITEPEMDEYRVVMEKDIEIADQIRDLNSRLYRIYQKTQPDKLREKNQIVRYSLKGESDILKQNAQMKEMNDYLKAQMELTSNVTADRKKTEAYGKSVLREYSSYMDRDEFISELHSIYNEMSQEQVDFDSIMGRARDLSSKVIEQASVLNDDMYKRYKELIDNVRTTPLAVQDVDKKEISYIVGDYNEFRKKNMGTLNLVNPETGGSSVDTYYQELVETYPEFFDEDIVNQGEQLVRIRNVVESLRPYRENPHSDFMDEAAEYLAQDLIDNFFEIPQTRPTFADKQQKRVDKERIKAANQRRDLREKQKARIEQIKSQHRDKTKELIAAEKEKRVGEVAKLKEKFKQKEQTKNQKISDRQLRLRIQRLVKEMNAKLLSPTDKHHVPEGLRKPVAEFLKSIDFSTSRQGQGTRNRLANLNLAYSRIAAGMDRGDSEYYLDIDPDLINMISDLQETIGDKRVVDMNSDELMKLWQITRIVRSSINNYNKLLSSGLREEVVFKGESVLEDLRKSKDKTESGYDMIRKIDNMVNLDMVAPADYFEMLGDTMYDLYGNLRRGLDKKVENTKTITDYMQKLLKDQDIKTWTGKKAETTDFTLKSGKKITLTPAQVMSLYLLEKRDQARGHIYGGGIKHAPIVTKKKGKTTITKTFEPARVTPEDVSMIIGNLTAEQKKIADGISEFLNTYTSDWGNEVSMALYGYKKFTEKNYFPIKSDDNYLVSEFGMPNDSTLRSKGFTKALTKGANNPIIIDDIFDVFAKITDDSSSYNAFVLPLSDLQKVVNYKGLTGTVKQAIEKRYGTKGVAYFRKLMQDINGGIRTEVGTELVKTLLSNFKAATMGLNIRVIVQQPTALIRATAMIDPKYLAAGVVRKGDWKKVTQYSQIAQWKSWGYFSMDIGRQMKDIIMGEKSMRDLSFKWIQDADNMAWGKLWNAVELETKDRHPNLIEGTDMFYEMVAKRFNDIVDRTQVVDTVLHRPQILRSNDTLVKVYTSFMGEPLKSFNMLRTNIMRAVESGSSDDKERAVRTSVAWLSSMLVNVLIVSLIDIYRGKGEDEDEFLEKYAKLVGGNALNDAIGMFPFVRDIVSMANGFSPKRMDLEGLNDATNATKRLGKAGSALLKGEPVENTPLYILKDTASAFSKLLGIPLKNVFREIESASNLVIDGFSAYEVEYALTKSMYNINHSENRGKFVDIMYKAMMEDDMESAKRIYNDMLVNGVSKSYIEYGYKTRQRKTLDGTSEIELVNDLVQKWNKTPESERTEAMKKDFESQAKAAYESLVEQGYTEEEVTKAVKRLKVPDKTMTMKELLKLYDAAKKDKSKQQEFYEAANRMIDAGYDEEDILAAIEVHKE